MKRQTFSNKKQKNSPQKKKEEQKKNNAATSNRLRTSQLKFEERSSDLYLLRNSYSSTILRNHNLHQQMDFRHSTVHNLNKNKLQKLKNTLNNIQDKLIAAQQQLNIQPNSMKKKSKQKVYFEQGQQSLSVQKDKELSQDDTNTYESKITLVKQKDKKLASLITNMQKPKNFKPFNMNPYSPRSPRNHIIYYISQAIRAIDEKNSLIVEHINASIKIINQCERYEIPTLSQMEDKKVNLKKSEYYKNKKTLVLDLDETLIHCADNYQSAQLQMSIKLEGEQTRSHQFAINIRPYAITFLKNMAKKFQIIIFTASQKQYADTILDQLDENKEIFQHRLYRQHCWVLQNEMHVKDLRIINRSLSDIVLVDNAAYSYAFQLQNGIPILPYYQGKDFELKALECYLDMIEKVPDVREINKKTFKLHHYAKFSNPQQLIQQLYINGFF